MTNEYSINKYVGNADIIIYAFYNINILQTTIFFVLLLTEIMYKANKKRFKIEFNINYK